MSKTKQDVVKWLPDVTEEDYDAAEKFLLLIKLPATVNKILPTLKAAPVDQYKATDLFRASRTKLAKSDDRACREEIAKIKKGGPLSPVLLVRDPALGTVIIADGYHRICAAFRIDPDVILHCKIA